MRSTTQKFEPLAHLDADTTALERVGFECLVKGLFFVSTS